MTSRNHALPTNPLQQTTATKPTHEAHQTIGYYHVQILTALAAQTPRRQNLRTNTLNTRHKSTTYHRHARIIPCPPHGTPSPTPDRPKIHTFVAHERVQDSHIIWALHTDSDSNTVFDEAPGHARPIQPLTVPGTSRTLTPPKKSSATDQLHFQVALPQFQLSPLL